LEGTDETGFSNATVSGENDFQGSAVVSGNAIGHGIGHCGKCGKLEKKKEKKEELDFWSDFWGSLLRKIEGKFRKKTEIWQGNRLQGFPVQFVFIEQSLEDAEGLDQENIHFLNLATQEVRQTVTETVQIWMEGLAEMDQ
jgi:hypothetical protein